MQLYLHQILDFSKIASRIGLQITVDGFSQPPGICFDTPKMFQSYFTLDLSYKMG